MTFWKFEASVKGLQPYPMWHFPGVKILVNVRKILLKQEILKDLFTPVFKFCFTKL
jgi:hypothetical protein